MELYVDLGAHSYSIYIENNILKDTDLQPQASFAGLSLSRFRPHFWHRSILPSVEKSP